MTIDETPRPQPVVAPEDWSYQTLFAVGGADRTIDLRLGTVILTTSEPVWQPTMHIVLDECQGDVAALRDTLHLMIGRQCDYVCDVGEPYYTTTLWLNYQVEEVEIQSRSIHESREAVSIDDCKAQFARLAAMHRDGWREQQASKRRFSRFKGVVTTEIEKEADRNERKYEFFKGTRVDKAETYRIQLATYRSVLALLRRAEEAGNR